MAEGGGQVDLPDLRLVKAADGANDNWTYLHKERRRRLSWPRATRRQVSGRGISVSSTSPISFQADVNDGSRR